MSAIRNVTIAGASGSLGSAVLKALLNAAFNVTVLTRPSSTTKFPLSVRVLQVDYDSIPSLTEALKDQDAVISTVGISAIPNQQFLIKASIAAGVKRFIPSEFSADFVNPLASKLPVYMPQLSILKELQEQVEANPGFTYTSIRTSVFLEFALSHGFLVDFKSDTTAFYDGGDRPFSTTSYPTIGETVVKVLQNLEQTRNRAVYVHDLVTTQRKVLSITQKLVPEKTWTTHHVDTAELEAESQKKYTSGDFGLSASLGFLSRAVFADGYGGEFKKVDNDMLGIGFKTDAQLEESVRNALNSAHE